MIDVYSLFVFAIGICSVALFKLRSDSKSLLDKIRRIKGYKRYYTTLTFLTWFALIALFCYYLYERGVYYDYMNSCCDKRIKQFKNETIDDLFMSISTLSKVNLSIEKLKKSFYDEMYTLFNELQDRTRNEIQELIFKKKTEHYDKILKSAVNDANKLETLRVKAKTNDGCSQKIETQKELFEFPKLVAPMQELVTSMKEVSLQVYLITSMISQSQYVSQINNQTAKFELSKYYIATNIDFLKNRANQSSLILGESKSTTFIEPRDINWHDITLILFYVSFSLISICSTLTLIMPYISRCLKKTHTFLEKISLIGLYVTIVVSLAISASFCGLSFADVIQPTEICSRKAKNDFLSNYTIKLMNTDLNIIEKKLYSTCESSNNSYFSELNTSEVFSTDSVIRAFDYDGFIDQTTDLPDGVEWTKRTVPEKFKQDISGLVKLMNELLNMNCLNGDDKTDFEKYRDVYKNLENMGVDFENGLNKFCTWKEFTANEFNEAFEPVRPEIDTQMKDIIKQIDAADLKCQPIIGNIECSKKGGTGDIGFFFCILLSLCLVSMSNQFLLSPWIVDKQNEDQMKVSNDTNRKSTGNGEDGLKTNTNSAVGNI